MTTWPLIEGFDNFPGIAEILETTGDITWQARGNALLPGVYGGQCLNVGGSGSTAQCLLSSSPSPLFHGLRVNLAAVTKNNIAEAWVSVSSAVPALLYVISMNPTNGVFQIYDHLQALQWTSGAGLFPSNTWFYLEFEANNGTGVVTFKVNNQTVATSPPVTLGAGPTFTYGENPFQIGSWLIDDLYWSTSGFLGDNQVVTEFPTSNSAVAWTSGSGNPNWQNVDTVAITSNNHSATSGQSDLFGVGGFPAGTISAVTLRIGSTTDNISTSGMAGLVQSGATLVTGPTFVNPTTQSFQTLVQNVDPATSAAWSTSGLNGAVFGYTKV